MNCRVLYETTEGLFVDAGSSTGLNAGDLAWLEQDGQRMAQVQVVKSGKNSVFLKIKALLGAAKLPAPGSAITLIFDRSQGTTPVPVVPSPTLRDQTKDGKAFVPLLVQPNLSKQAQTDAANIFHGRLTLRQAFQVTSDSDLNYSISRMRATGSVERIAGTPWLLEWSGELSYRAGRGLEGIRNFEEPRLEMYRLAMFRRFEDRSFIRVGRFIPRELPSVGFFDGVQGEKVISSWFRLGTIAGVKPKRYGLDPSIDEPTVVPYATFRGKNDNLSYSGTFGVIASLYKGKPDRAGILADQLFRYRNVTISSSTEIDFDVGQFQTRTDAVRLTRQNLLTSWEIHKLLMLRAGVDRFETPDSEAERSEIDVGFLDVEEFLDIDYWRYWVGGSHGLPWGLRLSEEISYTISDAAEDARWNVSFSKFGLPGLPDSSLTISLYNLAGFRADGYGGRLASHFTLFDSRLLLQPSITFRFATFHTTGENFFLRGKQDFYVSDFSLRGQWTFSRRWYMSGGASYSVVDSLHRVLVDLALTFRW